MLSSVSYACLGVCAGMWVISRGIYLGVLVLLFSQSSKTDQHRDGAWIVVPSSRKATCPVAMMNRYLDRAGLSCDSPLFCQLSKTKCGYKLFKVKRVSARGL